jgi:hypothetical protein
MLNHITSQHVLVMHHRISVLAVSLVIVSFSLVIAYNMTNQIDDLKNINQVLSLIGLS